MNNKIALLAAIVGSITVTTVIGTFANLFSIDHPPYMNTKIGNSAESKIVDVLTDSSSINRLAVDTIATSAGALVPSLTSKLLYEDMNASTGGVARTTLITSTTWTRVYQYTGSGMMHGWILNLETKDKWFIRFVADTREIFGTNGISSDDMIGDTLYDLDAYANNMTEDYSGIGFHFGNHDKYSWGFDGLPLKFNSGVAIYAKRATGETSKKFQAGLVVITKD